MFKPTFTEFKAELKRKGWTMKALAVYWNKSERHISRLVRNDERGQHWNDALSGLKYLPGKIKKTEKPKQTNTGNEGESMRKVNGVSIQSIARKFNAEIAGSSGHVLLFGATGTGKSTILESYLKTFPAAHHNFETREPSTEELAEEHLFSEHPVAVVDYIDFDSESSRPLLNVLKTGRARGHRLIVSTMTPPPSEFLNQFSKVYELRREATGEGIRMVTPGQS